MSAAPDPLESELSALQPREVSPRLRQRIAECLTDAPIAKGRRLWRRALVVGVAAACVMVILFRRESPDRGYPQPAPVGPRPAPPELVEISAPTLLAYQRALGGSPEELEALLNRQAVATQRSDIDVVRIGSLTLDEPALHALLGED